MAPSWTTRADGLHSIANRSRHFFMVPTTSAGGSQIRDRSPMYVLTHEGFTCVFGPDATAIIRLTPANPAISLTWLLSISV